MADERGSQRTGLQELAWWEIFPWLSLIRCVRLALAPRMLFLAAVGLVATAVGWRVLGIVFPESSALLAQHVVPATPDELQSLSAALNQDDVNSTWPWLTQEQRMPQLALEHGSSYPLLRPLLISGEYLSRPFRALFRADIGVAAFFYALLCALWALTIWSIIGGAITRIAALELARESRLGLVGGLRFAITKWPAYFFGPLVPMLGVVLLVILGCLAGLLMRSDLIAVVIGIGWPIMLAICFGVAILLIGLAFGWPLMWPTISAEGTDSFDALSRSYSYLFQRPLHYLFYALVAGFFGLLAACVVLLIAQLTVHLGFWAISWGTGLQRVGELKAAILLPGEQAGMLSTAGYVLAFWTGAVMLVATAFLYSYFWTAATGIYFLLRQNLDGMEPDEVALGETSDDPSYGLPPLAADELGVPRVVDPPPPAPPPLNPAPPPTSSPPTPEMPGDSPAI
jgi:hypothetical protein